MASTKREDTWDQVFANNQVGPGSFDVTELHIAASDTVAYCHEFLKICDATARPIIGLRKERWQWLIGNEHHWQPST